MWSLEEIRARNRKFDFYGHEQENELLKVENAQLKAEVARLKAGLEQYAYKKNWTLTYSMNISSWREWVRENADGNFEQGYDLARSLLKEEETPVHPAKSDKQN